MGDVEVVIIIVDVCGSLEVVCSRNILIDLFYCQKKVNLD
jgi:hypothetical protein